MPSSGTRRVGPLAVVWGMNNSTLQPTLQQQQTCGTSKIMQHTGPQLTGVFEEAHGKYVRMRVGS